MTLSIPTASLMQDAASTAQGSSDPATLFAAWATTAAAVVAAVTAFFIWRQVKAANEAIDVANKSLALNRIQHHQSLYTTTEAIKARIDAGMPKIGVRLRGDIPWPPKVPSISGSSTFESLSVGQEMMLPEHAAHRILVDVPVVVENEGEQAVDIHFQSPLHVDGRTLTTKRLEPGTYVEGFFREDRPMQQWTEILSMREQGSPEAYLSRFTIDYQDHLDTGAIDNRTVVLSGSVFERVPGSTERFRIPASPVGNIGPGVNPTTRIYWLSRLNNEPLPEFTWESITLPKGP